MTSYPGKTQNNRQEEWGGLPPYQTPVPKTKIKPKKARMGWSKNADQSVSDRTYMPISCEPNTLICLFCYNCIKSHGYL